MAYSNIWSPKMLPKDPNIVTSSSLHMLTIISTPHRAVTVLCSNCHIFEIDCFCIESVLISCTILCFEEVYMTISENGSEIGKIIKIVAHIDTEFYHIM